MTRDILFLLAPGFEDNDRREYCPECAEMWGVLSYFPAIKEALEIRYEPLAHPRPGLIDMLGEGTWNCPTLVLADDVNADSPLETKAEIKSANGRRYIDNARDIGAYFADRYGTPFPR